MNTFDIQFTPKINQRKMRRYLSFFTLIILAIAFHSCEKYEIIIGDDFQANIQPIFVGKCSACHPTLLPPNFTEGNVYTSLTQYSGGKLLDMDIPEESYILVKATDGHSANDINDSQKKAIISWITEGALEESTE
jgi:hypothetical protein